MAIPESTDFTDNALLDNGVVVSRTPITVSLTGNGDEVKTEGTPENITVIFHKRKPFYSQLESGQQQTIDGYIMTGPSQTINKNDKITYNGSNYRILNVIPRGPSGDVVFYKYCDVTLI
jgi:hypothetical protein